MGLTATVSVDASGQTPLLKMFEEPAQTVDVIARLYTQTHCSRLVAPVARSARNALWSIRSSTFFIFPRSFPCRLASLGLQLGQIRFGLQSHQLVPWRSGRAARSLAQGMASRSWH